MSDKALSAWLTLSFVPYIGSRVFRKLIATASPEEIIASSSKDLKLIGFKTEQIDYIKRHAIQDVEPCFTWLNNAKNHHILTLSDTDYPEQLKQIVSAPPVLFVKGNKNVLSKPQIAIVGSRNASMDGLKNARSFAADLSEKGIIITSGMALGIDGHAHDGALSVGGETIAVLGAGIENIYPKRHKKLSERIIDNGALVSEFRPDGLPKAENFPRRNRIISGLSLGVLVVEAAQKSGSLITARYATEQDREVFALPGSIHNPHARGGNELIKQGACLIQSSQEMLQEIDSLLTWSINNQKELFHSEVDSEPLPFPELLANVGIEEAVPVDILAQRTHIPVHEIMTQLLELELQGHVAAVSGGYIRTRRVER